MIKIQNTNLILKKLWEDHSISRAFWFCGKVNDVLAPKLSGNLSDFRSQRKHTVQWHEHYVGCTADYEIANAFITAQYDKIVRKLWNLGRYIIWWCFCSSRDVYGCFMSKLSNFHDSRTRIAKQVSLARTFALREVHLRFRHNPFNAQFQARHTVKQPCGRFSPVYNVYITYTL